MKKGSEELTNKVIKNLEDDRERLIKLYDTISDMVESDPIAAVGVAETVTKIVDAMTKQNVQLIEIMKQRSKTVVVTNDEDMSEDDLSDIYDKIQDEKGTVQ